jgi:hemerythrin-like domain-containing protein
MINPLDILSNEHRIIERGLRALQGICVRLEQGEKVPPEALAQLLDFIRTFADRFHHAKEEALLFPALEEHGVPRAGGPLGVMLYEHETARQLVAELARAVEVYSQSDTQLIQSLVETARHYLELLSTHIYKEDNVLFPMAKGVLVASALASLREGFAQVEAEFGAGQREKYEQIATELENTWAIPSANR